MNNDLYSPPETNPQSEIEATAEHLELASRGARLGASLIDSVIMMLFILPIIYFTGGFSPSAIESNQSIATQITLGLVSIAIFFMLNFKLLKSNGQTIGKKLLGTKIVDMEGNLPTFKDHLWKRYLVYLGASMVPVVGNLFSLVNSLFIFGKAKRCVHDYAGNTQVVKSTTEA